MAKLVKTFKPKYIKRIRDRPSGIAQTGAHATSAWQNAPDIHRLGWAPRPFPVTGMTGQANSSIMGRMGSGTLSNYTDEDREEYAKQSGPPGKGGNYKASMARHYINKGGGKAMIGQGPISESELNEIMLKEIIADILAEMMNEEPLGRAAFNHEILRAQEDIDEDEEDDEEDDLDEFSGAGAVAGFTLPLGMSNRGPGAPPPWAAYARSIGGHAVEVGNPKSGKGLSVRPLKILRVKKPKRA
jgi:hypothetical protein